MADRRLRTGYGIITVTGSGVTCSNEIIKSRRSQSLGLLSSQVTRVRMEWVDHRLVCVIFESLKGLRVVALCLKEGFIYGDSIIQD